MQGRIEFESIYAQYAAKIYRVCLGYVNDTDQAKDLTQETFIAVWKNLSSFRSESNVGTWVFRIATNNCLRALEKTRMVPLKENAFNLPDPAPGSNEDKIALLYRCISELEEIDRIIISLALESLPQAEIASVVGLSHATIRVRIHRIKEKLASKMKKYE